MLRRTKIVATLGPATDDPNVLADMVRAGLDVARINFSHGARDDARRRIVAVREAARAVGRHVGILGDLSGPKIRIESFVDGKVVLGEGQPFALDVSLDPSAGNDREVGCAYKDLPRDVKPGDTLLLADGFIILKVRSVTGPRIDCEVLVGGELSNRKGLNKHGGGLSAPALTDKDLDDLKLAADLNVDFIAVSFARDASDVRRAQAELRKWRSTAHVVAKIERHEAIENLGQILTVADAVMVARGDLGVEMGYAELTGMQKTITAQALAANRVVITATQMMESMISSPVPTRAEVSDVANAVLDGTDAVMLSGESAIGRYPVEAVSVMSQIAQEAETLMFSRPQDANSVCWTPPNQPGAPGAVARAGHVLPITEAVVEAASLVAHRLRAPLLAVATHSGRTALALSKLRNATHTLALTDNPEVARAMALYWGVTPLLIPKLFDNGQYLSVADEWCRRHDLIDSGDRVVIVRDLMASDSSHNAILVHEVE